MGLFVGVQTKEIEGRTDTTADQQTKTLAFTATEEKGDVSAILTLPTGAKALLVLGHGASSNMRSPLIETLVAVLASRKIATFRYNFPYSEKGGGRNSNEVCIATVRSAVRAAAEAAPGLSLFAGGHSFSGRMTSTAQSMSPIEGLSGLIFFSFPLHPAGARGTQRAEHLDQIEIPMLFLSGTRDALAELDLLEPVVKSLGPSARLHLLDTADHSFKVLKRSRKVDEDVFDEIARVADEWIDSVISETPRTSKR